MTMVINFSLDERHDRDIVRWLGEQSNRSEAIRKAIRAYIAETEGPTLADLLAEIRGLPSRLRMVAPAPLAEVETAGEEPTESAVNLDGLLSRLDGDEWKPDA